MAATLASLRHIPTRHFVVALVFAVDPRPAHGIVVGRVVDLVVDVRSVHGAVVVAVVAAGLRQPVANRELLGRREIDGHRRPPRGEADRRLR